MKLSGYIEGYFGKLLSWGEREEILRQIVDQKLNSYFYCPKEDPFHRLNWKESYPEQTKKRLDEFNSSCKANEIKFLFGISPGINFQNSYDELFKKISEAELIEISDIVILFDDLFQEQSGRHHAEIINRCNDKYKDINFYCVPSEYCEQLAKPTFTESIYLKELSKDLDEEIPMFWTGSKVVSSKYSQEAIEGWREVLNHKLIIWDNFYANDYCVPKVVMEAFDGDEQSKLENLEGILINGTGLLNVDKFCLGALANKIFHRQEEILTLFEKAGLPKEFEKISNLFKLDASFTRSEEEIRTIEFLLWEWTAPIKQEIYPYLHILRKFLKEDVSSGLLESRFNLKKID